MKRSLKLIMAALSALVVPALGWADTLSKEWTYSAESPTFTGFKDGEEICKWGGGDITITVVLQATSETFEDTFFSLYNSADPTSRLAMTTNGGSFSGNTAKYNLNGFDSATGGHFTSERVARRTNGADKAAYQTLAGDYTTGTNIFKFTLSDYNVVARTYGALASGFNFTNSSGDGEPDSFTGKTIRLFGDSLEYFAPDAMTVGSNLICVSVKIEGTKYVPPTAASITGTVSASAILWEAGEPCGNTTTLTATGETAAVTMDKAITTGMLTITGSPVSFTGTESLTAAAVTVDADTDVSAISANLGAVTINEGKTLTVGLNTKWTSLSGAGTITMADAVISLNIAKAWNGSTTNATTSETQIAGLAPVPGAAWVNLSAAGGKTENGPYAATETSATYWNGSAVASFTDKAISDPYLVTYSANNTYQWTAPTDEFLDVYLDDGGSHAQIAVDKLPFSEYSVIIYCATDMNRKFSPVTVNGTMYTVDENGVTKTATAATDTFGKSFCTTAQYATATAGNAIKIDGLSGALSIVGGGNENGARGGIAAIQIVNTGDFIKYSTIEKTITEDVAYSTLFDAAEEVETTTADITIANGKTLTIDKVPAVGVFKVKTQSASDIVTVKIDLTDPDQVRAVLDMLDTDNSSGVVKMTLAAYTGKAAWMAYEFNGDYTNTGSEGSGLSWDGGGAFGDGTGAYTAEMMAAAHTDADENGNRALRLPARPWRDVPAYPAAYTAVMYAKAGTTPNGVLVSFGSATGGQQNTVTLATGENPDKGEMRLVQCGNLQSVATDLVQNLAVPNSQAAYHLYAFAMYTKDGNSRAEVYVDGELLTTYTFDGEIALGTGLQVGSIHGGAGKSGLQALAFTKTKEDGLTDYDPATMDFIRVYDCLLSEEMIQQMAEDYPYTSPSGKATRTLDGTDANWVEAEGSTVWSQDTLNSDATTTTTTQNAPNDGTNIVLNASAETQLTVNLPDETPAYETLTVNGDVTFVAGEATEALAVSGRTTINGNVTVPYDLVHLSTVTVAAGKTLTIDASHIDLSKIYTTETIGLTGMIDAEEGADVVVTLPQEVVGRKAEAILTESGYVLSITMDGDLNMRVPAKGATWDELDLRLGETVIEKPEDFTGLAILLEADEGATLTLTEDVAAGNITLVNDLTVTGASFNGITLNPDVVLTTDVTEFTMPSVKAASTVTAETRPTVVLVAETVELTDNSISVATTWHNVNLTIAEGTTCNYSADRSDWTGSTITVNGTFNAASAQIWLGVTYDSLEGADTKLIVAGNAIIADVYLGGWGNTINNAIEVIGTGSLTIGEIVTHEESAVTISVAEEATLTVNKSGTNTASVENVTVAGTAKWIGTITGTLTLANGATLDVGDGLTVIGDITQQGDLTIKTTAEVDTIILTGGGKSSYIQEQITIAEPEYMAATVTDTSIKMTELVVCSDGTNRYPTVQAAVDALAAQTTEFSIWLYADVTDEVVTLPAGCSLTFISIGSAYTFSGTVKDEAGNELTAVGGTYTAPEATDDDPVVAAMITALGEELEKWNGKDITNREVVDIITSGLGASVNEDGSATFTYEEFKVSEITMDGNTIKVTVTVGDLVFADDVVVTLVDLDGNPIGTVEDGEATFTKGAGTQLFKAKAAKKVPTNEESADEE